MKIPLYRSLTTLLLHLILFGLFLCFSQKAVAQGGAPENKSIKLILPSDVTMLNLTLTAEGAVEAVGLKEPLMADGQPHSYTSTTQTVELKGRITQLNCANNKLKGIDVRNCSSLQELNCAQNRIEQLVIDKNRALVALNCSDNLLKKLKTSDNKKLERLDCSNTYITQFNLSSNSKLKEFVCSGNSDYNTGTRISTLYLNGCPALQKLDVSNNALKELDLSTNTELRELYCQSNHISVLNTTPCSKLQVLICSDNRSAVTSMSATTRQSSSGLKELDLSQNKELRVLDCFNNDIAELNLSENTQLEKLVCSSTELSKLDLSQNKALNFLQCSNKKLSGIDVTHNTELEVFVCDWALLESIDLTHNPKLRKINVGHNQLKNLDLSQNPLLEELACFDNEGLQTLNLASATELRELICNGCSLETLNLSANKQLRRVDCYENKIQADGMLQLINTLPQCCIQDEAVIKIVNTAKIKSGAEKNVCTKAQIDVLFLKNWLPINYNNFANKGKGEVYYGSDATPSVETIVLTFNKQAGDNVSFALRRSGPLTATGIEGKLSTGAYEQTYTLTSNQITLTGRVEGIEINKQGLTGLDLSRATSMRELYCANNEITGTLDLSQCKYLQVLECENNRIEKLQMGKHPWLTQVNASNNQLTKFDLQAENLTKIAVAQNNLPRLDLKASEKLQVLNCGENKLEELFLNSQAIRSILCQRNALNRAATAALVASLPVVDLPQRGKLVVVDTTFLNERNDVHRDNVVQALEKNWLVLNGNEGNEAGNLLPYFGTTACTCVVKQELRPILYPNPADREVFVAQAEPQAPIFLFSMEGCLLYQTQADSYGEQRIELFDLQPGSYIVRIGTYTLRLLKR